jgi:riboflavin kinase
MELRGIVSSGLGRAHVFMAQPHYQDQFKEILGAQAWPGTLNVRVDQDLLSHYIALRQKAGIDTLDAPDEARTAASTVDVEQHALIRIRGFLRDGVSFGGASAFHGVVHVNGSSVPCAVLIPDLTRHVDVIEVISTVFLRENFDLHDGDRITITL